MLHPDIIISIMTEFVENVDGPEVEKQDCERNACWRLMERLEKAFPHLRMCICADSLYACESFFKECEERKWTYILRYKEGSIPSIAEEYETLKAVEGNRQEHGWKTMESCYDYVTEIDYRGCDVNVVEYEEKGTREFKKGKKKGETEEIQKRFLFLTNLPVSGRNVEGVVERGRMRWKIENEGFNTQKRQGYHLEHQYSKNYQAIKNHYYLTQIGHMIAQMMEAWKKIWGGIKQSREQKHRRLLESYKKDSLKEQAEETRKRFQIRII